MNMNKNKNMNYIDADYQNPYFPIFPIPFDPRHPHPHWVGP